VKFPLFQNDNVASDGGSMQNLPSFRKIIEKMAVLKVIGAGSKTG
jgi:hypothetical protein